MMQNKNNKNEDFKKNRDIKNQKLPSYDYLYNGTEFLPQIQIS